MDIKGMLLNKTTVGASLVLVGAGVALGANLRILNRVLFSLPMVGDVTITRIMGLVVGLLGVAVLTGFDPLSLEDEV
jgi:hypothetical protein|tara:strand:- start:26 stop:256 length:231 start_codon:yes stop_codon:yes gene_type:complete